jgi:uncharacterized protein YceK
MIKLIVLLILVGCASVNETQTQPENSHFEAMGMGNIR